MDDITPAHIKALCEKYDSEGFLGIALKFHRQLEEVLKLWESWEIALDAPDNVIIMGLGGSAIGGDLIRVFSAKHSTAPVLVCRDYHVPEFVGPRTLCIASSYSGNTEETLSSCRDCLDRGAKVVCISTDGKLEKIANGNGLPFYRLPAGLQPRAALGYSFAALYAVFSSAGLIPFGKDELKRAAEFLQETEGRWGKWQGLANNPPLDLAVKLKNRIPVVYGASGWLEVMAYRWKCQFNENAKMFSPWAYFPEMNHNEIVGWGAPPDLLRNLSVIILSDEEVHPRVRARIRLTRTLISKTAPIHQVNPEGETVLEKLLYMVLFGDVLTIYLALLYGKDPAEIDSIHWLKAELANISSI